MAMDSFTTISNTNIFVTKNEFEVNHQIQDPIRFSYQNGDSKPEDNTPLQAQQEDPVEEVAPHELATGETTLTGVYPTLQDLPADSLVSWKVARTIDAEIPRIVSIMTWTSAQNPGDLLSILNGSDQVETYPYANPFLLPNSLFNYSGSNFQELRMNAASGLFESLFVRHALYRSGFVVEATINGTQFHGGSIILVAIPVPHVLIQSLTNQNPGAVRAYTMFDLVNMSQLGIYPSVRILPRSNSAGRLVLPYVGNSPVLETAGADVQYAIFAIIESKLSVPVGTAPTVTLTLRVGAKDAAFYGPKSAQRIYTNILDAFRLPFDVPNPASLEAPVHVAPGQGEFVNTVSQSIQVSRRIPSIASSFLPARVEDFRSILSRPTILSLVEFTSATTVGTNIFQIQVAPTAVPIVARDQTSQALPPASVKRLTGIPYLAQLSRYFTQWRGSITYTLEYTGPAVSAGRLLLAFQPGRYAARKGDAVQYMETGAILQNFTEGEHIIWDLSNSTSVSITCPYSVATPWAPVTTLNNQNTVTSGTTSGMFLVAVLSPLITPTVVAPTSDIIIHVSAGPDFELRYPAPISVNTIPLYNGVLDQSQPQQKLAPGEKFVDISGDTNVERFFSQARYYGTFSAKSGTTASQVTIPLSLVTYAPSSAPQKQAEVPFRMFAGLFSFLKADLRITIGIPFSTNVMISYRPPGITQSAFEATGAGAPDSAAALANGPSVILSTRANNMGTEIFIPFDSYAGVFQTSNNIGARFDTRYDPAYSQVDPGDLGTLFVAARLPSSQLTNVAVFIALENVEAYVPRAFGPTTSTTWSPALPASILPNPDSFSWEEVEEMDTMPPLEDEKMDTEYQAPRRCSRCSEWLIGTWCWKCQKYDGTSPVCRRCHFGWVIKNGYCEGCWQIVTMMERASYEAPTPHCAPHCGGVDRWICRCEECLDWITGMVSMFEDGYELDDGGRIEFNLRLHGFLPMNVEVAEYLGWNLEELVEARPGWSVESLLSEIQETEEIEAEWRQQLFDELPLGLPAGPDYPGQWYDNEWYREFLPLEKTSPFSWHETPYSKALLVYDPSRLCRFYHFLWNDTRHITWLSMNGKHLEALEMARNHPARRIVVPIKLGAEFVKVASMADDRRSSFILERDLAEVRAAAMTNTVKASALFRSALRRVEYRRLTSWEEGEVKKTIRFLLSLEEESDEEFFQDDELLQCEYEAPLGSLPAPPGPPGVRINTQQVAQVAAQHGVVTLYT